MADLKQDDTKVGAAKPDAAKPKRNYFGVKNAVVAGAGALLIAAVFARAGCDGQDRLVQGPDRPVGVVVPMPTAIPVAVCSPPVKGDNNCEREKGEHDLNSKNWDPQSCGYCGDRIAQDFETAEECPVDFACGNGRVDRNVVYGAYLAPREENGVYSLGTLTVAESCRESDSAYCASDCGRGTSPRAAGSGRRTEGDRPPRADTTDVRPPSGGGGACPTEVLSLFRGRANALKAGPNLASIRANCPDSATTGTTLRVHIVVQGGFATSATVSGCGSQGLSVNLGGIPAGVDSCSGDLPVTIPPG